MKRISIKTLTLAPFKGIGSLTVDFANLAEICGENGSGKSTIADAWLWLISGKNIAGLTATGKGAFSALPIDGTPSAADVTAEIDVDGDTITLRRHIEAKGKSKTETFYRDDIEVQKKKYDDTIAEIFSDDFRILSIPGEFLALDAKQQRAALLAGTDIKPSGLADKSNDLECTIAMDFEQCGFEDWEKSTKRRIKETKDGIAAIPAKIKVVNELRPETRDYEAIKAEIAELEKTIVKVENPDYDRLNKQKADIYTQFSQKRNAALQEANAKQNFYNDLRNKQAEANNSHLRLVEQGKKNIAEWETQLNALREQFFKVRDEQFTPDTSRLICPLAAEIECQNPILLATKEEAQKKAALNFEKAKAAELDRIQAEGMKIKDMVETTTAEINKPYKQPLQAEIEAAEKEWHEAEKKIPTAPDTTEIDRELNDVVAKMRNALSDNKKTQDRIAELNQQLGEQSTCEKCDAQLATIENERTDLQNLLGRLEETLAVGLELKRKQMREVERTVNDNFPESIRFKFFEEQVNGEFADACNLYIDSIPYGRGANRAGEINASIAVLAYLQKKKGIALPVFIDNAESVNEPTAIDTQTILLRVTTDTKLIFK